MAAALASPDHVITDDGVVYLKDRHLMTVPRAIVARMAGDIVDIRRSHPGADINLPLAVRGWMQSQITDFAGRAQERIRRREEAHSN